MGGDHLFAQLALLLWIPVAGLLFSMARPAVAAMLVALGGMLLLPERVGFDFPMMPAMGKREITSVCLLLGLLVGAPTRLRAARPGTGPDWLITMAIVGAFVTALTNTDPLQYGSRAGYRLTPYDGLSMAVADVLTFGLPFFLGRAIFRTRADLRDLMIYIAAAGVIYTAFILVELRLSPHIHKWTYGYHPTTFRNVYRLWGYRPIVYMPSGLALALFMCATAIAAASLTRARINIFTIAPSAITAGLSVIVVLCKGLGAMAYGLVLIPLTAFGSNKQIRTVLLVIMASIVAYPLVRTFDLVPIEGLTKAAANVSAARAQSLEFRFTNERLLADRAKEKLLFGWGHGSRNRVFNKRGRDLTTADGFWIIQLGQRGLVGWLSAFGLLLLPVWLACQRYTKVPSRRDRTLLLGLSTMVVVHTIDLQPNGLFTTLPYFLSGALYGTVTWLTSPAYLERVRKRRRMEAVPDEAEDGPPSESAPSILHS